MHEQSETIQRPDGKWINVYGRGTSHVGRQLPGTDEYPTVDAAITAARERSAMTEAWRAAPLVSDLEPEAATVPESDRGQYATNPAGAVTGALPPPRRGRIAPHAIEPTFQEAWRSAPVVEPTLNSKAGALGQGATGGFIETAPAIAGAVAGAKIGSLGGPWGMAGGTVLGGISGLMAGKTLRGHAAKVPLGEGTLTTPTVEDMPPGLRPYGHAGEVIGAGGPIATMPLAAGASRLPEFEGARITPFVNRMIESAQRHPAAYGTAEAAGLTGAAVAGGVSESYLPGQTGPRLGAEIAGGFFNPTRLIVGTAKSALDLGKTAISQLSKAGTEGRAAGVLQNIVTQAGEDPAALAKLLRESGLPGVQTTSAQLTGSPALIALESRLAQESSKFGAESRQMATESLSAIKNMIAALEGTGNPAALKAAAEMRAQYFRTLLAGRVQLAEQQATEAAGRITPTTPAARSDLARDANAALEGALRDTRAVERGLWEKVPRDVPATAENVIARYGELRTEMLPEEPMPAVASGFFRRMTKGADKGQILGPDGKPLINMTATGATTSGEIVLLRSRMLGLAREAEAQGKFNDARIYGNLAEAALDDLERISAQTPGLTEARQFSRELNDTFTRTFAGEAMATRKTGADRIPPELMLRRAMGTGKEAGALRLKQLEEAMAFLPKRGLGGPEAAQNLDFMLDAQQMALREAAASAINPTTGRASPIMLSRFMANNAELMERFPDIKKMLQEAVKSETGLQDVERWASNRLRSASKTAAFAKVSRFESPADAVRKALTGSNPTKDFTALARLAHSGGRDAIDGLKVSAWEDAIRRASTESGELSFSRLQAVLFNPTRPGSPSLINMMKAQGLMSPADVTRTDELIKRALNVERAVDGSGGQNWGHLVGNFDGAQDLAVRIIGAKAGTLAAGAMGPTTSGHTLIAAGAGSSYARKVFEKVPQGRIREVLIEAAVNPKFAAMLLMKPKSKAEGIAISRQLHSYLLQAGITADDQQNEGP